MSTGTSRAHHRTSTPRNTGEALSRSLLHTSLAFPHINLSLPNVAALRDTWHVPCWPCAHSTALMRQAPPMLIRYPLPASQPAATPPSARLAPARAVPARG